jgi:RNA polymerase sigma-70 factor (ECF subfamily)
MFRTWLLSITWRKAIDRRKSASRWLQRLVTPAPAGESGKEPDPMQKLPSRAQSQEDELLTSDLQRRLRPLIASLPKKLRDALLLAGSGDHTYEEIGQMLNIPVGTVKWRVSEARKVLKQKMTAMGYSDVR